MLNKVIIAGRITAKPELKKTNTGDSCVNFTLAVERDSSDKTDFINFSCFKNNAEILCKYVNKGDMITVEGKLETYKHNDKSYIQVKVKLLHLMNNNKCSDTFNDIPIPEGDDNNGKDK